MKELSIKEKAKAYDEAIKRAKAWKTTCPAQEGTVNLIEDIFPELVESEDERIRKALVKYLKERAHSGFNQEVRICNEGIAWLEKQGEQKFKIGDWVVYDGWVCQIIDVTEDGYCNSEHGFIPKDRKDSMRLWTIQDAKDGDVLVHNGCTFIFMGIKNGIVMGFEENIMDGKNPVCFGEPDKDNDYYPATKKQRDILMKAMADARYTFDFEKKELRKIEHNPWSEEDEDYYDAMIAKLEVTQDAALLTDNQIRFLKSLKERYTWKPSDKQMEVLWKYAEQNNYDGFILTSLHEQLKKLKG